MFDATDFFGNETFIGKRNSVSYDILIDRDDNHGNLDITAWRDEGRRRISVGNYFVHPDKTLEQEVGKFLDLSLLPQGVDVYFDSVEIHHECDNFMTYLHLTLQGCKQERAFAHSHVWGHAIL